MRNCDRRQVGLRDERILADTGPSASFGQGPCDVCRVGAGADFNCDHSEPTAELIDNCFVRCALQQKDRIPAATLGDFPGGQVFARTLHLVSTSLRGRRLDVNRRLGAEAPDTGKDLAGEESKGPLRFLGSKSGPAEREIEDSNPGPFMKLTDLSHDRIGIAAELEPAESETRLPPVGRGILTVCVRADLLRRETRVTNGWHSDR